MYLNITIGQSELFRSQRYMPRCEYEMPAHVYQLRYHSIWSYLTLLRGQWSGGRFILVKKLLKSGVFARAECQARGFHCVRDNVCCACRREM
jgi:hypothetical protein